MGIHTYILEYVEKGYWGAKNENMQKYKKGSVCRVLFLNNEKYLK